LSNKYTIFLYKQLKLNRKQLWVIKEKYKLTYNNTPKFITEARTFLSDLNNIYI